MLLPEPDSPVQDSRCHLLPICGTSKLIRPAAPSGPTSAAVAHSFVVQAGLLVLAQPCFSVHLHGSGSRMKRPRYPRGILLPTSVVPVVQTAGFPRCGT